MLLGSLRASTTLRLHCYCSIATLARYFEKGEGVPTRDEAMSTWGQSLVDYTMGVSSKLPESMPTHLLINCTGCKLWGTLLTCKVHVLSLAAARVMGEVYEGAGHGPWGQVEAYDRRQ